MQSTSDDSGLDFHLKINFYLFLLLRSANKTKRGVEFRHSTRNASDIQQKVGKVAKCLIARFS